VVSSADVWWRQGCAWAGVWQPGAVVALQQGCGDTRLQRGRDVKDGGPGRGRAGRRACPRHALHVLHTFPGFTIIPPACLGPCLLVLAITEEAQPRWQALPMPPCFATSGICLPPACPCSPCLLISQSILVLTEQAHASTAASLPAMQRQKRHQRYATPFARAPPCKTTPWGTYGTMVSLPPAACACRPASPPHPRPHTGVHGQSLRPALPPPEPAVHLLCCFRMRRAPVGRVLHSGTACCGTLSAINANR